MLGYLFLVVCYVKLPFVVAMSFPSEIILYIFVIVVFEFLMLHGVNWVSQNG
jgi:hypothetical protein